MKGGMGEPERIPWAPWKWDRTEPLPGGHHFLPTLKSIFAIFFPNGVSGLPLRDKAFLVSAAAFIILTFGRVLFSLKYDLVVKLILGSIFLLYIIGQPAWHVWCHRRRRHVVASELGLQIYALPRDQQKLEWRQVAWREGKDGVLHVRLKHDWILLPLNDYAMGAVLGQIIRARSPEAPVPSGRIRAWAPWTNELDSKVSIELSLEQIGAWLLDEGQKINLSQPIDKAVLGSVGELTLSQDSNSITIPCVDPRLPQILAQPQVAASLQRSPAQTSASDPITKLLNRLRLGGRKGE